MMNHFLCLFHPAKILFSWNKDSAEQDVQGENRNRRGERKEIEGADKVTHDSVLTLDDDSDSVVLVASKNKKRKGKRKSTDDEEDHFDDNDNDDNDEDAEIDIDVESQKQIKVWAYI
jgi:hypothetical protein